MSAASMYTFQPGYRVSVPRLNWLTMRKEAVESFVRNRTTTIEAVMSVVSSMNMYITRASIMPRGWRWELTWGVFGAEVASG